MDTATAIRHLERLRIEIDQAQDFPAMHGVQAQVVEFLGLFGGSAFLRLAQAGQGSPGHLAQNLRSALTNFRAHLEAGLLHEVSPERRAQLDVVSDLLHQAHQLLEEKGIHPAAPIVIVGATLEEFLRTWAETKQVPLHNRKGSLDAYAHALFSASLISKQDLKDITAWAGLRNHAAHGEWAEVSDKERASLMLEGVNLFMRKYGA